MIYKVLKGKKSKKLVCRLYYKSHLKSNCKLDLNKKMLKFTALDFDKQ